MGGAALAADTVPVAHSKEKGTIVREAGDMPAAVAHTRARLVDMASGRDVAAFVAAMKRAGDRPKLSSGGAVDPQKLWADAFPDDKGAGALDQIVRLLSGPGLKRADGSVEWPYYVSIDFAHLTPAQRQQLELLFGQAQLEDIEAHGYIGWRLKISGKGRWELFATGG